MFEDDKKPETGNEIAPTGNSNGPINEDEEQEDSHRFSKVAMAPQHKQFITAAAIAGIMAGVYFLFFGMAPSEEQVRQKQQQEITERKEELIKSATPVVSSVETPGVSSTPKLPEPLPVSEPKPPAPPPPPLPVVPPTPFLAGGSGGAPGKPSVQGAAIGGVIKSGSKEDDATKKRDARRKVGIMVLGGKSGKQHTEVDDKDQTKDKDQTDKAKEKEDKEEHDKPQGSTAGFMGFSGGGLEGAGLARTSAQQVTATYMGNTDFIVAQGKMINAVLETAINTDLPGDLLAIITRDVYAESGRNILIPKGAKAIGIYQSEVKDGQTRVAVNWTRLIMPNGIDIQLDSRGTDPLGRAGVAGELDNKFWTKINNAFMISYVVPLAMGKLTKTNNSQISTTTTINTNGNPTTQTSGTTKAITMKEASDKFGKIAEEAINSAYPTKPTITVDQGTEISIFVQKDVVFPAAAVMNRTQVIR